MVKVLKNLFGSGLIILAFFFLFNLKQVYAVEGTCSWHGGVDCYAGADLDGSAICADGWRDSSERFYSQKMCTEKLYHCSTAVAVQLNDKYRLVELYQQVNQKCSIPLELLVDSNDTISESRDKAIKSLELNAQCSSATNEYDSAQNQYYRECYSIGRSEYYKMIADFTRQYQQTQAAPKVTCPANSVPNGDKCTCPESLFYNGTSCVAATQICQSKLGPNSYGDSKQCYCSSGYIYDTINASCVLSGTQLTKDDQCKKFGFGDWYNTEKQSCETCPSGTIKDPGTNKCIAPLPPPVTPVPVLRASEPSSAKPKIAEQKSQLVPEPVATTSNVAKIVLPVVPTTTAVMGEQKINELPSPRETFWQKIKTWFKFW